MNILAHSFLSGDSDELKLGNFIGDYVKGSDYEKYPQGIQKGIILHRNIDYFTDHHPVVNQSKSYLYPVFHKYAGIFVDIFYDHFLAKNWSVFSDTPLDEYINQLYDLILDNYDILPKSVKSFIKRFVKNDWITCYKTVDGIDKVLLKLSQQTSLPKNVEEAKTILLDNYDSFKQEFADYFPDLVDYVSNNFFVDIQCPPKLILKIQ